MQDPWTARPFDRLTAQGNRMKAKVQAQNAALVEQAVAASQMRSGQASELPPLMGFFKLGDMGLSRHADA